MNVVVGSAVFFYKKCLSVSQVSFRVVGSNWGRKQESSKVAGFRMDRRAAGRGEEEGRVFLSFRRKGEQEGRWLVRRSGRGTEREQVEEQGTVSGECFKDGYRERFWKRRSFFVGRRE